MLSESVDDCVSNRGERGAATAKAEVLPDNAEVTRGKAKDGPIVNNLPDGTATPQFVATTFAMAALERDLQATGEQKPE